MNMRCDLFDWLKSRVIKFTNFEMMTKFFYENIINWWDVSDQWFIDEKLENQKFVKILAKKCKIKK